MKKLLSRIWEAPQKALAHIIKWIIKAEAVPVPYIENERVYCYLWDYKGGLSLSNHIFLPRSAFAQGPVTDWKFNYIHHEYGHTRQSHALGPFYLLVVGLPSIIWAGCFKGYREKHNISYYSFYTEACADKLGGVKRED
jgi:hypothetical protein